VCPREGGVAAVVLYKPKMGRLRESAKTSNQKKGHQLWTGPDDSDDFDTGENQMVII